jgi:hypothetical protein
MAGIRPKQLARLGEFHLEEAVLDVLLEAAHEDECLGAAEISKRAGIFREGGGGGGNVAAMNDAIVTGLMIKLFNANKVERCEQRPNVGGWKLTDAEFNRRRDDVPLG